MSVVDLRFRSMGCDARIRLEGEAQDELEALAAAARAALDEVEAALSRFDPDSELSRLNRDARAAVPASPVVQRFVEAAAWAARTSDGLVDATLAGELAAQGYAEDWDPARAVDLDVALAAAPARRPAQAHAAAVVARVDEDGRVQRPPGVALDAGGIGKGLAADLAIARLGADVRAFVAVGGDVAVRGAWPVVVEDARDGHELHRLELDGGAVATSGIQARLWRRDDGRFAHHLLEPATGEPAWTGLVAVTAVGRTAVEAEVLAKSALLRGPLRARRVLRRFGGVLQGEEGQPHVVPAAPVVRLGA